MILIELLLMLYSSTISFSPCNVPLTVNRNLDVKRNRRNVLNCNVVDGSFSINTINDENDHISDRLKLHKIK
jgi:hypothetical protein